MPAYIGTTKTWNTHIQENNIVENGRLDFGVNMLIFKY